MGELQALYLHVGHGKTGSSFIQSSLSLSIDQLMRNKITYPISEKNKAKASKGYITSGNLGKNSINYILNLSSQIVKNSVLLSSEHLFLPRDNVIPGSQAVNPFWAFDFIDEFRNLAPIETVSILLFIRDPLDHAASIYQQMIKRKGEANEFEEVLNNYSFPQRVFSFLQMAGDRGHKVHVKNYSRHEKKLLMCVEQWLGLEDETLVRPPIGRVNRSMTLSELQLQMSFNKRLGVVAASLVSDALCNHLPDIASDRPPVSKDALAKFIEKMQKYTDRVASMLPESEQYHLPDSDEISQYVSPNDKAQPLIFSREQIDIVAEAVAQRIKMLIREKNIETAKRLLAESQRAEANKKVENAQRLCQKALDVLTAEELTTRQDQELLEQLTKRRAKLSRMEQVG